MCIYFHKDFRFNNEQIKSTIKRWQGAPQKVPGTFWGGMLSVNFLFCGFMGSGKSTLLAKLLAENKHFNGYDLDHEICRELGIDISSLGKWIDQHSLSRFRQVESTILRKILSSSGNKLIALGGGTLEAPGVMDEIRQNPFNKLIFLDVDFETCFMRIAGDFNRPLLALGKERLKKLHAERLQTYRLADAILTESEIKEIDGIDSLVHNLDGL